VIADLSARGVLGTNSPPSGPITVQAPDQVINLTAGHLSAADAAQLAATGEQATAVLVTIKDVEVSQAALPGPTASLCDLTLRVTRSSGSCYDAQSRSSVTGSRR
jgi:hypothetical protein